MTTSTKPAAAQSITDDVLQSASDAAGKAAQKARDLRDQVEPTVDQWTARIQSAAQHALDAAAERSARARESLARSADVAGRYVADQPLKSVLIAAAAGAVITALIVSAARRR